MDGVARDSFRNVEGLPHLRFQTFEGRSFCVTRTRSQSVSLARPFWFEEPGEEEDTEDRRRSKIEQCEMQGRP